MKTATLHIYDRYVTIVFEATGKPKHKIRFENGESITSSIYSIASSGWNIKTHDHRTKIK